MNKIDDRILAALNSEDREVLESFAPQPGFFGMLFAPLRGSFGPIAIAAFVMMLAVFGLLIYSAFQFFPELDLTRKLNWMAISLALLIMLGLLRLWYFQEISRLSILMEVKRLELQVSLLVKKLNEAAEQEQ
jgi:hypothetical protein